MRSPRARRPLDVPSVIDAVVVRGARTRLGVVLGERERLAALVLRLVARAAANGIDLEWVESSVSPGWSLARKVPRGLRRSFAKWTETLSKKGMGDPVFRSLRIFLGLSAPPDLASEVCASLADVADLTAIEIHDVLAGSGLERTRKESAETARRRVQARIDAANRRLRRALNHLIPLAEARGFKVPEALAAFRRRPLRTLRPTR